MAEEITKDIVVLYHADCTDGFSAAWAARKKFGDSAEYIPVFYEKPIPKGIVDKEVYTLDFTYQMKEQEKLIKDNKRVTSIDHHASQEAEIRLTEDYVFDNTHSGAFLAWQYFNPDQPVPQLILYVEDSDLKMGKYPETVPISNYAYIFRGNFDKWDKLVEDVEDESTRKLCIEKGQTLTLYSDVLALNLLEQKQKVLLDGHEVYAVNAPRVFRSQIGVELAKQTSSFGIVWYQEKDRIHVSLRSIGNVVKTNFDVCALAKKFGGGGHKSASAFHFPADQAFPWTIIK